MPAGARIANPQYLVETDWLAAHLADPELREVLRIRDARACGHVVFPPGAIMT